MVLSTDYLGLDLAHPIVPSASPLTEPLDTIRRLEDAGAPAIVMHSLFREQINAESRRLDHYLSYFSGSAAERLARLATTVQTTPHRRCSAITS